MPLGDELELAWKHLGAGDPHQEGWQTISVTSDPSLHLLAGRHFPDNEQALLVGFPGLKVARKDMPTESEGFIVEGVTIPGSSATWLAVTRKAGSGLDLFQNMAADLAEVIREHSNSSAEKMFRVFVGRIRAWQEFMRKSKVAMSAEEELGLVGELSVLSKLIGLGLPSVVALRAWEGPLGGLQDFVLGPGAIEVKSSLSTAGFPARVASLDQLDDAVRQPLFVAAVRLRNDPAGATLPHHIQHVRSLVSHDPESTSLLLERLWFAGYNEEHASLYERGLSLLDVALIEVDATFPRLTPGTVPPGVRQAVYDIELDQIQAPRLALADALKRLGVF